MFSGTTVSRPSARVSRPHGIGVFPVFLALCGAILSLSRATALTLEVDRVDDDPASSACTPAPVDCSLRGALELANISAGEDTIVLPDDTLSITQSALGGLEVTGDLIVRGVDSDSTVVTTGGSFSKRAFRVAAGAMLTLEDLALVEFGETVSIGGAILVDEADDTSLVLRRVRLEDNIGTYGGAVALEPLSSSGNPMRLQVFDSIITRNRAAAEAGNPNCAGGGLFLPDGEIVIHNTTISNNAAGMGDNGAGICVGSAIVTITDSTFSSNRANDADGSAIFSTTGQVSIRDSTFSRNEDDLVSPVAGSVVYQVGGSISIDGSGFARNGPASAALLLSATDATISNTSIALSGIRQVWVTGGTVEMNNVILFGGTNSAMVLTGTQLTGTDVVVERGASRAFGTGLGGGMLIVDSVVELSGCALASNTAESGGGLSGLGGAVYAANSTVTFEQCSFYDNLAEGTGGAIAVNNTVDLTVRNSTFSNNQAVASEGLLAIGGSQVTLEHVTFAGSNGASMIELASSSASFSNTAIAGTCSLFASGGDPDSLGGNVAEDSSCLVFGSGDLLTDDLLLHPLADNGGAVDVLSHLPRTNSPLLGLAASNCLSQDQRGESRDLPCDAGAIERVASDENLFGDGFESDPSP